MHVSHDISIWIAALLTLGIFSFLYRDNPVYKFCEHLFVGVSAGYYVVLTMISSVWPNMLDPLFNHFGVGRNFLLVIPLVLGILLFLAILPPRRLAFAVADRVHPRRLSRAAYHRVRSG